MWSRFFWEYESLTQDKGLNMAMQLIQSPLRLLLLYFQATKAASPLFNLLQAPQGCLQSTLQSRTGKPARSGLTRLCSGLTSTLSDGCCLCVFRFLLQPSTIAAVCSASLQPWNPDSLVFQQPLDFSRWRMNVLCTMRLCSSVTMMHCFQNGTQEKRRGLLLDNQRRRRTRRNYYPKINFQDIYQSFFFSHLFYLFPHI